MNWFLTAKPLALAILITSSIASLNEFQTPSKAECDDGVALRAVTDKKVYSLGESLRVQFLITNHSAETLYLFKMSTCTSQLGWLSLEIRDSQNKEVEMLGCSSDSAMVSAELFKALSESKFGVSLDQDQTFGITTLYDLPSKRGTYQLRPEIIPMGYVKPDLEDMLSSNHMRILRKRCSAPFVTITVK
jgi:hypothetical protein